NDQAGIFCHHRRSPKSQQARKVKRFETHCMRRPVVSRRLAIIGQGASLRYQFFTVRSNGQMSESDFFSSIPLSVSRRDHHELRLYLQVAIETVPSPTPSNRILSGKG